MWLICPSDPVRQFIFSRKARRCSNSRRAAVGLLLRGIAIGIDAADPGMEILVERWFRELTDKALRRGVFHSVPDLVTSIQEYINAHNHDPKPYVWTATAESILAKVARGRITLEKVS